MKPFFGIAVAAEEIWLPGTIGGDAGHLVDLGLIGHRVGGVGRGRRQDQVDLVRQDEFGRHFRGACAARLAVLADDLDLIGLAAALQPLGQDPLTCSRMKPSASPKPASGPVFGLTWPILMAFDCALAGTTRRMAGAASAPRLALTTCAAIDGGVRSAVSVSDRSWSISLSSSSCKTRSLPRAARHAWPSEMLHDRGAQRGLLLGAPCAKPRRI